MTTQHLFTETRLLDLMRRYQIRELNPDQMGTLIPLWISIETGEDITIPSLELSDWMELNNTLIDLRPYYQEDTRMTSLITETLTRLDKYQR